MRDSETAVWENFMSKVKIKCPRCQDAFVTEEADLYECPQCGTNIRARKKTIEDEMEKTQTIKL